MCQSDEAYAAYDKIFQKETANAPQLKASMPNEEYLDTLSAPRIEPGGKTKQNTTPRTKATLPEGDSNKAVDTRPPTDTKVSPKGNRKKAPEPKE